MEHRTNTNSAVPILLYHSIADDVPAKFAEWAVPPRMFAAHMEFLSEHQYTPITVTQFAAAITGGDELLHADGGCDRSVQTPRLVE